MQGDSYNENSVCIQYEHDNWLSDTIEALRFHMGPEQMGDRILVRATLPHQCDAWVIGGVAQVDQLIADLQVLRVKMVFEQESIDAELEGGRQGRIIRQIELIYPNCPLWMFYDGNESEEAHLRCHECATGKEGYTLSGTIEALKDSESLDDLECFDCKNTWRFLAV